MKCETSLDRMVGELVHRGLPIDYAQRAAAELRDHHLDLVAEAERGGLNGESAELLAAHRLGDAKSLRRRPWRWKAAYCSPPVRIRRRFID